MYLYAPDRGCAELAMVIPSVVGGGVLFMGNLADLAQIGTFFIALFALKIAYVQIVASRESQREATAKDVFRDYLQIAFENPNYATPNPRSKDDEKYKWFVAVTLNACDEIAGTVFPDPVWRHVVRGVVKLHEDYLVSAEFMEDGGWEDYSKALKAEFDGTRMKSSPPKHDDLPV
jgi:hypothetical protein